MNATIRILKDVMCVQNEEEKDMVVVSSDIKSKLEDLKKRAMLRKKNPDLSHFTTEEQKQLMNENVKDMYQAQMDTIKENN